MSITGNDLKDLLETSPQNAGTPAASPKSTMLLGGSELSIGIDNTGKPFSPPIKPADSGLPRGAKDPDKQDQEPTLRGRKLDTVLPERGSTSSNSTAGRLGRSFQKAAAYVLPGVAFVIGGGLLGGPVGALIGLGVGLVSVFVSGYTGEKIINSFYDLDQARTDAHYNAYQALKGLDDRGELTDGLLDQWAGLSSRQQRELMEVDRSLVRKPRHQWQVRQAAIRAFGSAMDRGMSKADAFQHAKTLMAHNERLASYGFSPENLKDKRYRDNRPCRQAEICHRRRQERLRTVRRPRLHQRPRQGSASAGR